MRGGILKNPAFKLVLTAFVTVFISEMGDKTQVTTMLLAGAKPAYVLEVAAGSAAALVCAAFIEVAIGAHVIGRYVKPEIVRLLSGILFVMLGFLLLLGIVGTKGVG